MSLTGSEKNFIRMTSPDRPVYNSQENEDEEGKREMGIEDLNGDST